MNGEIQRQGIKAVPYRKAAEIPVGTARPMDEHQRGYIVLARIFLISNRSKIAIHAL
jgi:hypothetical protein